MLHPDRTVKILLGAIVLLLTIIAFRPMLSAGSRAVAADDDVLQATPANGLVPVARLNRTDIEEITVLDHADTFILQFDTGLEVYKVMDRRLLLLDIDEDEE